MLLLTWLVFSVAFWLAAKVVPGFRVEGFLGAVVASAIFGLLNFLLGKILFILLGVATLGVGFLLWFLTRWIVNAILLKLAAALTSRFAVRSFGVAFVAGLVISVLAQIGEWLLSLGQQGRSIWV